ncbi:MAG TPA: iron ABC transporter permease [Longimicrobiales bacterium]|nr:iron ABC transporter permease [Longimicrobiales bacterium]
MKPVRLLAWPLIALLLWLVVYPNAYVAVDSFVDEGVFTLRHYARFIDSRAELTALWNSVWISLLSVVFACLLGVPLAFLFTRREFPGRRMLGALVSLPVLLPPLIGVIAFMFLFGESGFLARGVQALLRLERSPWRFDGPVAILAVHAYTMYVYVYLFTAAGLARLDEGYAEAAASLGASRAHTLRRVTLPMLAPSIGGAALLVFMTSMASFSAPYVFGGGFRVLTTQIFTSKLNNEAGMAAVETVILAGASLLFLAAIQRFEAGRTYTGAGKGSAAGAGTRALGAPSGGSARAWGWTALAATVAGLLLLPHATVLLVSFVPPGSWTVQTLPPEYSLESYAALASRPELLRPIVNSLRMAAVATVANVVLAFAAGWLLVRARFRGQRLLDALVVLPWALPGTVIAVALASTFAVNQPWAGRFLLLGTFWILPLAYFIRNIPLVTRAALASFRQLDPSLEEAAASLGAGWRLTARRIVLPLVLPGLAAGASLAFVTALGEFVSSILLYSHGTRPISIEILSQLRAYDLGAAAAYGVLLILLMGLSFVIGFRGVSGERA